MFKRILVPVDGSETATKALVVATQLASQSGGQVLVAYYLDEVAYALGMEFAGNVMQVAREEAGKILAAALAQVKAAGVPGESQLLDAVGQRLGELVADEARRWGADLIVVGTHGRRGIGRALLGSGAEQVIRLAPVPTLVVRGG